MLIFYVYELLKQYNRTVMWIWDASVGFKDFENHLLERGYPAIGCPVLMSPFYILSPPQCTPEQISGDLHDELMHQLEHDDNLQKVSLLSL